MITEKSYFLLVLEKTEKTLAYIAGSFIIFAMLLVTTDVFLRNIFNKPITGVYEIVGFLFVAAVGLGFSYVQGQRANISINIATRFLSNGLQKIITLIGYLLGLLTVMILAWQNGVDSYHSFKINEYTMGIVHFSLWPAKMMLTFGLCLLAIRLVYDIFSIIKDSDFIEENY